MFKRTRTRREFLASSSLITGAVALPSGSLLGCSDGEENVGPFNLEWEDIADGLEQNNSICCWQGLEEEANDSPPIGAHLPKIELTQVNGIWRARVYTEGDEYGNGQVAPHPMTEGHWITTMYVRNQYNYVVRLRDFGAVRVLPQYVDTDPVLIFDVPAGTTELTPWAFCNLHQHWKGTTTTLG